MFALLLKMKICVFRSISEPHLDAVGHFHFLVLGDRQREFGHVGIGFLVVVGGTEHGPGAGDGFHDFYDHVFFLVISDGDLKSSFVGVRR